jgi:hypothetical protein
MALFVVMEEALFARDGKVDGPLKHLLTGHTMAIEPKGLPIFKAPNYCRFAFVSNDKYAVPMTDDERRFQPFEVSDHRTGDQPWFNRIVAEMKGGGLAAMFYDLKHRAYDEDFIRATLDNDDLNAMKSQVIAPPAQFLATWLHAGCVTIGDTKFTGAETFKDRHDGEDAPENLDDRMRHLWIGKNGLAVSSGIVKRVYDAWCKENLDQFEVRKSVRNANALMKELHELLPIVAVKRTNTYRGWDFPPRATCLGELSKNPVMRHYLESLGEIDGVDTFDAGEQPRNIGTEFVKDAYRRTLKTTPTPFKSTPEERAQYEANLMTGLDAALRTDEPLN